MCNSFFFFSWTRCEPSKVVLDWSEDFAGSCYTVGLAAGRNLCSEADEADVKAAGLLLIVQWSELWTHTSIWSLCTFTPYCLAPLRSDKPQHLAGPPNLYVTFWLFMCGDVWSLMWHKTSYWCQESGWQLTMDVGLGLRWFFNLPILIVQWVVAECFKNLVQSFEW